MNEYLKISIVTPTYNQGQYIEKMILSIIEQDYPNLQFIVIDGGSTDGTVEILKKHDAHIDYWVTEKDEGQSDAINKGLKKADGDIINWLNSDDYLAPGVFHLLNRTFLEKQCEAVCGYSEMIYPDRTVKKRTSDFSNDLIGTLSTGQIMQPSTYFKKEVFDAITPVESSLHYLMDHYILLRYIMQFGTEKIEYTENTLSHVLMHDEAKSVGSIANFKHDRIRIYRSLFAHYGAQMSGFSDCKHEKLLQFPEGIDQIKTGLQRLNFELLWDYLFDRDHKGEKINLNRKVLRDLLAIFPLKFTARVVSKLVS